MVELLTFKCYTINIKVNIEVLGRKNIEKKTKKIELL